jgi:hypothetical protein
MKTAFAKTTSTIITVAVIVTLTVLISGTATKAARLQTASMTQTQPGSELFGSSYCSMMNALFAASGR